MCVSWSGFDFSIVDTHYTHTHIYIGFGYYSDSTTTTAKKNVRPCFFFVIWTFYLYPWWWCPFNVHPCFSIIIMVSGIKKNDDDDDDYFVFFSGKKIIAIIICRYFFSSYSMMLSSYLLGSTQIIWTKKNYVKTGHYFLYCSC